MSWTLQLFLMSSPEASRSCARWWCGPIRNGPLPFSRSLDFIQTIFAWFIMIIIENCWSPKTSLTASCRVISFLASSWTHGSHILLIPSTRISMHPAIIILILSSSDSRASGILRVSACLKSRWIYYSLMYPFHDHSILVFYCMWFMISPANQNKTKALYGAGDSW